VATKSFLFVDQVGSTEQLARLGDARAKPVREALAELLTSAVDDAGGTVVDNTGDGVMAVFDGATDAVLAAVGMQRSAKRQRAASPDEERIRLRVGLHTGEVTADENGRWFGMAVVVAARLCSKAGTDEILASSLVGALAADLDGVHFDDAGAHELKGVASPVATVVARWVDAADDVVLPPHLAGARRTPLQGRVDALDTIAAAWVATGEGAGARRAVFLAGEPGIGKTRLTAEAAHRAASAGALVVEGGCEEELPVPFRPFGSVLRGLTGALGADAVVAAAGRIPGALARLVPELGTLGDDGSSDPAVERLELFDAVDDVLSATSSPRGTVVVLEDLHWADAATLQLVSHLVRSPAPGRLLLLATYRESDLDEGHPLPPVLADLWRTDRAQRIGLDGLDDDAVRALFDQITGVNPPAPLVAAVREATNGNPFFVEEVARHLLESGRLGAGGTDTSADGAVLTDVPDRLRDVIRRRAARLGDDALAILRAGAVMGRAFSVEVLERLGNWDVDLILDTLDRAAAARLVHEVTGAGDHYRFDHALIRQALYEELSSARRIRLHRAIAEVLDTVPGVDPSDVAFQWRAGAGSSGHERAVAASETAAGAAMAALAYERAAQEYESALAELDRYAPDDHAWRTRLLLGRGAALASMAAPRADVQAAYLAAADLARAAGDPLALADATVGVAGEPESMMVGQEQPVDLLEEAIDALGDLDPARRCRLLGSLSSATAFDPERDPERAVALSAEALEIAEASDDPELLGFALRSRLRGWFDPLAVHERRAASRRLIDLGLRSGDRSLEGWGHTWESVEQLELGDREGFVRSLEQAEEIAVELRDPFRQWQVDVRWTTLDVLDGDLAAAEARASASLADYGQSTFAGFAMAAWGIQMIFVRFIQGRAEEMAWALNPETFAAGIPLATMRSDPDRCRADLDTLLPQLDTILRPLLGRLASISVLANAAHTVGHLPTARYLRGRIEPYLDATVLLPPCSGSLGSPHRDAGLLAELDGDLPAAVDHMREAVARNEAAQNRPMAIHARQHLGRLLRDAGDTDGEAMLAAANVDADAIGMATV
jgi:class 3 adenylate cyclase